MEMLAIIAAALSLLAISALQSSHESSKKIQQERIRVRKELARKSQRNSLIHEWGERRIKEH